MSCREAESIRNFKFVVSHENQLLAPLAVTIEQPGWPMH